MKLKTRLKQLLCRHDDEFLYVLKQIQYWKKEVSNKQTYACNKCGKWLPSSTTYGDY